MYNVLEDTIEFWRSLEGRRVLALESIRTFQETKAQNPYLWGYWEGYLTRDLNREPTNKEIYTRVKECL